MKLDVDSDYKYVYRMFVYWWKINMNFVGPHSTYLNRQNDIQINTDEFTCACLNYGGVPLSPLNPVDICRIP
jgi:hypothetical protein